MALYQSNVLIGIASQHMADYRFSKEDAAEVGMLPEDTGVIVLLILYFLEREPKICCSKIEYYILLLTIRHFESQAGLFYFLIKRNYPLPKQQLLFTWDLKGNRIRNFKKFINFMIEKKLISRKGKRYLYLQKDGEVILHTHIQDLCDIKHLLNKILRNFGNKTAELTRIHTTDSAFFSRHFEVFARFITIYRDALSNAKQTIREYYSKGD